MSIVWYGWTVSVMRVKIEIELMLISGVWTLCCSCPSTGHGKSVHVMVQVLQYNEGRPF